MAEPAVERDKRGAAVLDIDDAMVANDGRSSKENVGVDVASDHRLTLLQPEESHARAQSVLIDQDLQFQVEIKIEIKCFFSLYKSSRETYFVSGHGVI